MGDATERAYALTERAEALRLKKQYVEAAAGFTRALDVDPDLAAALALRGDCYRRMQRHSDAMNDLNRAVSLLESKEIYLLRAHLLRELGRDTEALSDLDRALELDATFSDAIQLRESLKNLPTYEQALVIARQMGAREPQTTAERIAAGHGASKGEPFSGSARAIEREHLWALALMRGEDPRQTVK
jgi:tetratricopeptide (TPR) repeat protein